MKCMIYLHFKCKDKYVGLFVCNVAKHFLGRVTYQRINLQKHLEFEQFIPL